MKRLLGILVLLIFSREGFSQNYFGYVTVTGGADIVTAARTAGNGSYVTGFTSPGSGATTWTVVELSGYIRSRGGISGRVRLGLYDAAGTTLVCEGTNYLSIANTETDYAWKGHIGVETVKAAGGVSPCTITGGTVYKIGITFNNTALEHYRVSGATSGFWTYDGTDNTAGMPAAIPADSASTYYYTTRCGVVQVGVGAARRPFSLAFPPEISNP
jgi:hypothetical protein